MIQSHEPDYMKQKREKQNKWPKLALKGDLESKKDKRKNLNWEPEGAT